MGILMGFTDAAPSISPILGGVLAEKLSWHWIFWLLSILGGIHLLALFIFLPETSRKLVGDGSTLPARLISRSIYSLITSRKSLTEQVPPPFSLPNPLIFLSALFNKSNFIVLVVGGLQYIIFGCLAASPSTQAIHLYSLNYLTAGLLYLPSGIGGIITAYLDGRLLNYDYRVTARNYRLPVSRTSDSLARFPIERVRLRSVFLLLALSAIATAGSGWTLQAKTSIARTFDDAIYYRKYPCSGLLRLRHLPDRS